MDRRACFGMKNNSSVYECVCIFHLIFAWQEELCPGPVSRSLLRVSQTTAGSSRNSGFCVVSRFTMSSRLNPLCPRARVRSRAGFVVRSSAVSLWLRVAGWRPVAAARFAPFCPTAVAFVPHADLPSLLQKVLSHPFQDGRSNTRLARCQSRRTCIRGCAVVRCGGSSCAGPRTKQKDERTRMYDTQDHLSQP